MEINKFKPVFEKLEFSDEDKKLVSPFFTNLDESVFGITFLPPEVAGALCSRTSRAKDDLRVIFLQEFLKPFLKDDSDYSKSLKALVEFLQQNPIELIFSNPKAREFYIKWLAEYGDDSIAQMAGAHLVFAGISQVAIKHIEDMRVGIAPIEKSTRYVDYSTKVNGSYRYYTDPTLQDIGLLDEYKQAMDNLFETYTSLMQEYMDYLKNKFSGEEERVLRTKAFDTLRTLLPVSTLSQVAFFANGQAFEYMVNRCLDYRLGEIRWTGQRSFEELSKFMPAFLRRTNTELAINYREYLSGKSQRVREAIKKVYYSAEEPKNKRTKEPSVKLLEFDADGESKIIAGLVFKEVGESFDMVLGKVRELSESQKEEVLKSALKNRTARYYKVPRAFENVYLRFEILMNIGAWRDLHRHRMHTQERQLFTINNGFDVPDGLKEAGLDKKFVDAILQVEELFRKVAKHNVDLAQYCVSLAHKIRFIQYQNMRSFFWEAELRTIAQGHPDYREVEKEKIRLVQKIYPLVSKYLLVDMGDYDFARRGDTVQIQRKEKDLQEYFAKK
ncbi:MAG: FAD-dependent thymidylate synthase [Patescibacteria group bacterium]